MDMGNGIASIFADQGDSAKLKSMINAGDQTAEKETFKQFEALFIQQMLKSMRTASLGSGLFDSEAVNFYRDMYDQRVAAQLSESGSLGIAEMINRQLGSAEVMGKTSETAAPISASVSIPGSVEFNLPRREATQPTQKLEIAPVSTIDRAPIATAASEFSNNTVEIPESPQDFVDQVRQFAESAAKRLGISADVLIGIAALETGWGKHTPQDQSAQSSNNYFGIKANNAWQGEQVISRTLEFADGMFNALEEPFRVYDSMAESFEDFADFLLENERYSKALNAVANPAEFLGELQDAGYATDPNYANKVMEILKSNIW